MKPIGYWLNGVTFLCVMCARFSPGALAVIYAGSVDKKCAECGKTIPANRECGSKGWKKFKRQQQTIGEDNGCI